MNEKIISYIIRNGTAISILINTLLGGKSNQTFSARNYQWKKEGRWNLVKLIDAIFFFQNDHCLHCWVYWYVRKDVEHERALANEKSLRHRPDHID